MRAFQHSRTFRIAILSVFIASVPACSANAGSKRKFFRSETPAAEAPPSGRIAYRPALNSWWNRPKEFHLQGYAGANYDLQTRNVLRETRYEKRVGGHSGHGH